MQKVFCKDFLKKNNKKHLNNFVGFLCNFQDFTNEGIFFFVTSVTPNLFYEISRNSINVLVKSRTLRIFIF